MKNKIFYLMGEMTEKMCFSLKAICNRMPVRVRINTVLTLIILFAILNIFITYKGVSSIFENDDKERTWEIKHIENSELLRKDSINNQFKNNFYENK